MTLHELLDAALKLPEADRGELAYQLLHSLPHPPEVEHTQEELEQLVCERIEAIARGECELEDAQETLANIDRALAENRAKS